jgi:hypothetical protein
MAKAGHAEPRKIEMKFKEAIETIGGGGAWRYSVMKWYE